MDPEQVANLVSHGGVVALAVIVWYELREHRKELKQHLKEETKSREALVKMGELLDTLIGKLRDRELKDFIREEISGVHDKADPQSLDDATPVEIPMPRLGRMTPPKGSTTIGGYGPQPGKVKDKP